MLSRLRHFGSLHTHTQKKGTTLRGLKKLQHQIDTKHNNKSDFSLHMVYVIILSVAQPI